MLYFELHVGLVWLVCMKTHLGCSSLPATSTINAHLEYA